MIVLSSIKKSVNSFVELFKSPDISPLKALPENHPQKRYCYTLVGYNNIPIPASSLSQLGFIGQVRDSDIFVVIEREMLWDNLNTVVKIAKLYNIHKIRKYHDSGHGIEWESLSQDVYKKLIEAQLFAKQRD